MFVKYFTYIYALIAVLELLTHVFHLDALHYFTKPAILLSLIVYFNNRKNQGNVNSKFTISLILCWIGDVLLMFAHLSSKFFIFGLVSFLLAHIGFIYCNIQLRWLHTVNMKDSSLKRGLLSIPALVLGLGLINLLNPKLGDLRLPVMIYAVVIMLMVVQSTSRLDRTSDKSFWLVYAGSLVFVMSDSLLAINKFYSKFYMAQVLIMSTYIAAVYLIVEGVLTHPSTVTMASKKAL